MTDYLCKLWRVKLIGYLLYWNYDFFLESLREDCLINSTPIRYLKAGYPVSHVFSSVLFSRVRSCLSVHISKITLSFCITWSRISIFYFYLEYFYDFWLIIDFDWSTICNLKPLVSRLKRTLQRDDENSIMDYSNVKVVQNFILNNKCSILLLKTFVACNSLEIVYRAP